MRRPTSSPVINSLIFVAVYSFCCAPAVTAQGLSQSQPESPKITELKRRVESGDKTAVERFWEQVRLAGTPLVEPIDVDKQSSAVTFLWRGNAGTKNVLIMSPIFPWMMVRRQMTNLPGTDVWYKTVRAADDLRFTYLLSENDPRLPFADPYDWPRFKVEPIPDPLNPRKFIRPKDEDDPEDEASAMSLVEMPGAYREPFNKRDERAPAGRLEKHQLASRILGNRRRVWVYTPPGYSNAKAYTAIVLFDGWDYLNLIPTPTILDNLEAAGKIPPVVAVFVANPVEEDVRAKELTCNPKFADFVARELMPWVRSRYRVSNNPRRVTVGGISFGGLAAACVALKRPDIFGNVLSQSGSYWWGPEGYAEVGEWLTHQFVVERKLPLRFYLEVGKLEVFPSTRAGVPINLHATRHLRDVLRLKGNEVFYSEFDGAHEYINWRESLAGALQKLLGKRAAHLIESGDS
jgi:enterochelin esterase-like enzyme